METVAEAVCREVYAETRDFYARCGLRLGAAAHSFRILHGPPVLHPPILFIGFQPGGREEAVAEERDMWPSSCVYALEPWRLWCRMREIWGAATLEGCTGLNLIFFRAPRIAEWGRVDAGLRADIEKFCRCRVDRIVTALAPRQIVIIGLGTFDRLTRGGVVLRGSHGRVLAKQGTLYDVPAYGIVHLSGARISREDRDHLRSYLRKCGLGFDHTKP
jgi:hypothetical protein